MPHRAPDTTKGRPARRPCRAPRRKDAYPADGSGRSARSQRSASSRVKNAVHGPASATDLPTLPAAPEQVRCRPVLGGLIRDYTVTA